ncbi:unnamed protein product [Prorocentrum cordatum]|uniref:Uncharacterized protein n=1 Tax=Prorocentrum cordatum TaxID=2364126 RepID=A0ABN9X1G1_9DINO|nr:unnamed protein product [Polarella glacialis]
MERNMNAWGNRPWPSASRLAMLPTDKISASRTSNCGNFKEGVYIPFGHCIAATAYIIPAKIVQEVVELFYEQLYKCLLITRDQDESYPCLSEQVIMTQMEMARPGLYNFIGKGYGTGIMNNLTTDLAELGGTSDLFTFLGAEDGEVTTMLSDSRSAGDIEGYDLKPSNFTLSIVVKMWGKRRDLDRAFAAVREALQGDQRRQVDSLVGACLVGACLHNRNPDRALEALSEIKAQPRLEGPCASTYSSLVCGLVRCGRLHKAVEIAEEASLGGQSSAKAAGLTPEALQQLLRALQQQGLAGELGAPLAERLRAAGVPSARALGRDAPRHQPTAGRQRA